VECVADPECKAGQVCRIGACEKGSKELRQCAENRDCAWPETCYFGQCVAKGDAFRCNTDLDCGAGHRCVGGRCL
jgi:Cys-rich repeat protein